MKKMNLFFSLATVLAFSGLAHAAPHPATATSKLVSPQLGVYRSPLGFQVASGTSGWQQSEPPKENKFIAAMYKSVAATAPAKAGATAKKTDAGTLTVRIDNLGKETTLDKYVGRWMKEYPKYGFDVLGSKAFTQNKQKGYVLDLINRESNRQLRQVVFLKAQNAVILTCRDQIATFKDSLKGCNQIIRTFTW